MSELWARKIFNFLRRPRKRRCKFSRSSRICICAPAPRLLLCPVVRHTVTKALSGILSVGDVKFRVLFCLRLALFFGFSSTTFIPIFIESLQSFSMELRTSTTRTLVHAPEHTSQQSLEHEYEVKVRLCSPLHLYFLTRLGSFPTTYQASFDRSLLSSISIPHHNRALRLDVVLPPFFVRNLPHSRCPPPVHGIFVPGLSTARIPHPPRLQVLFITGSRRNTIHFRRLSQNHLSPSLYPIRPIRPPSVKRKNHQPGHRLLSAHENHPANQRRTKTNSRGNSTPTPKRLLPTSRHLSPSPPHMDLHSRLPPRKSRNGKIMF